MPLFSLTHQKKVVWYCTEKVYPGRIFQDYALLGDDIVIRDPQVAEHYLDMIKDLGVKILMRFRIVEFAKRFRILEKDLSPVSCKMLRCVRHSIGWVPVMQSIGCDSLQISLRLRGAGYRRYSKSANSFSPHYNRHGYRHVIIAYSPAGRIPLPFKVWLGWFDHFHPTCYQMGMIRYLLLESAKPDWRSADQLAQLYLDDKSGFLSQFVENHMLKHWLASLIRYQEW